MFKESILNKSNRSKRLLTTTNYYLCLKATRRDTIGNINQRINQSNLKMKDISKKY